MDRNELNNNIFDRLTEFAAVRSLEEMALSLPSGDQLDSEVSLRPEFEQRMELLFRTAERKLQGVRRRKRAIKAAVAIAATLVVFTTVVASVEAFRVPVLNFFMENGDGYMSISIMNDGANYDDFAQAATGLYLPSYIPEAYSVDSIEDADSIYAAIYKDATENLIIFKRLSAGTNLVIDTEDVVIESLTINGESAQYSEKHGFGNLIFTIEDNFFLLSGGVGKDEMVKIAESVKIFGG